MEKQFELEAQDKSVRYARLEGGCCVAACCVCELFALILGLYELAACVCLEHVSLRRDGRGGTDRADEMRQSLECPLVSAMEWVNGSVVC